MKRIEKGAPQLLARWAEASGNPKGFNVNSRGWQPTVATARPCDPERVEPAAGPSRSAPSGPGATCAAFRGLAPTAIHVETLRVSPPVARHWQESETRLIENQTKRAFTLHELLTVIIVVAGMALLAVQAMAQVAKRSPRIQCANNLMQINVAFRVWAGNHLDRYPQQVGTASGGAMINGAAVTSQNTYTIYQCMSNELATPKIVVCPSDGERNATTNFLNLAGRGDFNNMRVSYWVGRDADQIKPQMFLAGDRNVYGTSASVPGPTPAVMAGYGNSPPSGILTGSLVAIGTNVNSTLNPRPVGFTDRMHRQAGNVAMADGSVQQLTSLRFYAARSQTGDTTILAPGQNTILFP